MNTFVEQINSIGKTFINFSIPMLIQSSILIIILLILDIFLRKRIRAVFRYWIWMIVLVKLILPPTLSLPTSPAYWFGDKIEKITESYPATEETDIYHFSYDLFTRPSFNSEPSEYKPEPAFNNEVPIASTPIMPKISLSWQAEAFIIWLTLCLIMSILLIQRTFFVKRLINKSQEANEKLINILEHARLQMSVKKKIALRLSDTALSPSVCGLLKPTILIPKALAQKINSIDFHAILLHELTHIKRYDLWVNLVQAILQIIYIYNPLFWIANIVIRNVREQAVDEMVLVAMGEQAEEYPKTLLNISKLSFGSTTLSLRLIGVAESKKALFSRIKHITSKPFPKTVKLGIASFTTIVLAAFILLPMAKGQRETEANNTEIVVPKAEQANTNNNVYNIRGRVTDKSGNPVSGALVEWGVIDDLPQQRDRTKTNANGDYLLSIKRFGVGYRLGVSAKGFAPAWYEHFPPWNDVFNVSDQDAAPPKEKDFILEPAHHLKGIVVDQEGHPISGAVVKARTSVEGFSSSFSSQSWATMIPGDNTFETKTNNDGEFQFNDLPAGSVNLNVTSPHRHVNDENYSVDSPCRIVMSGSGRPGYIQAQVVDYKTGQPIKDYKVALRHNPEQLRIQNKDGRFEWKNTLTEGNNYSFHIYSKGYLPWSGSLKATPLNENGTVTITLSPGKPMLGCLIDNNTGKPIAGASVLSGVRDNTRYFEWSDWDKYIDGYHGLSQVQRATTDLNGQFWFCEDVDKAGTIIIFTPEYERMIIQPENRPLMGPDGRIRIVLRPQATIQGTLMKNGKPYIESNVQLWKENSKKEFDEFFEYSKTNTNGHFVIDRLAPGTYNLSVEQKLSKFSFKFLTFKIIELGSSQKKNIGTISIDQIPTALNDNVTNSANDILLSDESIIPEEETAEDEWEAKYSDVKEFVKLENLNYFYDKCREMYGKDDLPLLYKLLKDEKYAPYWHNIAEVIGIISDDPNSVPVLLEYFQRDEGSKIHSMLGKICTIEWIGLIGGDMADSILQKAVTREGSIELAKDWIEDELWTDKNLSKELLIGYIQGCAMKGLVFTRKTENIKVVEKIYTQEKNRVIEEKSGKVRGYLTDAMAANDYIADHNNDVGAFLRRDPEIDFSFSDYIRKYRVSIPEEDSANETKPAVTSTSTGGIDIKALKKALFTEAPNLQFTLRTNSGRNSQQMQAIKQLEAAGSEEAINVLLECLISTRIDSILKQNALTALGRIGTKPAIEAITKFESWSKSRYGNPQPFYMGALPSPIDHLISAPAIPLAKTIDSENKTWALVPLSYYGKLEFFLTSQTSGDTWSEPLLLDISGLPELRIKSETEWNINCQLSVKGDLVKIECNNRNYELKISDQIKDTDKDGLPDIVEAKLLTDPKNPDSDKDGIPDGKDSNPLTPKHKENNDTTEICQAAFSIMFAASNSQDAIVVVDRGEFAKQEYYGFAGPVIRVSQSRQGIVNLTSIDIRNQSDDSATVNISDYVGSESASEHEVKLKKINGKWVVVEFVITEIS